MTRPTEDGVTRLFVTPLCICLLEYNHMAKIQKIRLKDLLKPTSSSVNQSASAPKSGHGSSSGSNASSHTSSTSKTKGASSISTRSGPRVIKLDVTGLSASQIETRTLLEIDELSSDRRRVNKRTLDVTNLSPVKKRREGLGRERLVFFAYDERVEAFENGQTLGARK